MPPPGIPDWVFPGALVQREGVGPLYAIGVMELHDDLRHLEVYLQPVIPGNPPQLGGDDEEVQAVYLGDLLLFWRPTGNYLYPRGRLELTSTVQGTLPLGAIVAMTDGEGETNQYAVTGHQGGTTQLLQLDQREGMPQQPEDDQYLQGVEDHQLEQAEPPQVDEYYRWEDVEFNQVFIIYIEGIVDRHVEVECVGSGVRTSIPMADFMAALARGPQDTPPGPNARHLASHRDLPVPQSYRNDDFQPGDIRIDDDGQEIVLIGYLGQRRGGYWLCCADFDLDEYSDEVLETTILLQHQPAHAPMQPPTHEPTDVPMLGRWYRWYEATSSPLVTAIYVERFDRDDVVVTRIARAAEHRISMTSFTAALARGYAEAPGDQPYARLLGFSRLFVEPVLPALRGETFTAASWRVNADEQEFVLMERRNIRDLREWVCLSQHDMRDWPLTTISESRLVMNEYGGEVFPEAWNGGLMDFDQMERIFRDLMEDQATIAPLDLNIGVPMSFQMAEQMFNSVRQEDADDARRRMNPGGLTRMPLTGFAPLLPGDPLEVRAITEMRIGDGWHFEAPNEGRWHVETITNTFTPGTGNVSTIRLRGDDQAVIQGPVEWVVRNGRRISPPDPRYTGDPIEVGQVWEIATTLTRQPVAMWRVRLLGISSNMPMVSLEPANGGPGATIYWPEVRLRAQGRYVAEARVRRTAFERILAGDDDG